MADDTQQDAPSQADTSRPRRPPPTIDLEASDVTTAPRPEGDAGAIEREGGKEPPPEQASERPSASEPQAADAGPSSSPPNSPPISPSISPWVIAPFSGAVAAALVIGVGWMLGWPAVQAPPQIDAAAFNAVAARVAGLEAKTSKPSADAALAARTDALDKSIGALRSELGNLSTQSDKLAATVDALKSAPRDAAGTIDLSPLNNRIAELERALHAQSGAIAQQSQAIANSSKAADDQPLRRVVGAALLDVAVRHGDPYASVLVTAKALAPDPDVLKPLEPFAATGVPNPPMLSRELLALVPKLSPAPPQATLPPGAGIIDRLQAGAAKLVKIERTDSSGNDRGAVVARATTAALHNNFADAQRELNTLSPSDRAPVQAWLDKVDARAAALAASRQFADSAMAALAKPGQ